MEPRLGQLVVSIAGRDKGRRYIVIRILSDTFVAVADGTFRSVSDPKKKNVRHLMMTRTVDGRISSRLLAGVNVGDEEVREALRMISEGRLERTDWSHG